MVIKGDAGSLNYSILPKLVDPIKSPRILQSLRKGSQNGTLILGNPMWLKLL